MKKFMFLFLKSEKNKLAKKNQSNSHTNHTLYLYTPNKRQFKNSEKRLYKHKKVILSEHVK